MLMQTNSYVVPREKRAEHARLLARFRQTLARLGCEDFECYEQVGANWSGGETTGRFVQIMRFRDRKHQQQVQSAERGDPQAQALIKEFCELINFPYQQQHGLFAAGFYSSVLPTAPAHVPATAPAPVPPARPDAPPTGQTHGRAQAAQGAESGSGNGHAQSTPQVPPVEPRFEDLDISDEPIDPAQIDPSAHRA
jgi:hypothetical protein